MIRFFQLFLFFTFFTSQAQNPVVFEFSNLALKFDESTCFTNKTDFENVQLKVIEGNLNDIKSFRLTISLDENIQYTFTSFTDVNSIIISNWLNENEAFRNFKTVNFKINVDLNEDKKSTQVIDVCLFDQVREDKKQELLAIGNARNASKMYAAKKAFIEIPVSFVTDRNDTKSKDLNERFGGKRAEIQYGKVVVTIPYTHTLGEIERPSYWKLEFSEDPNKHITLQALKKFKKNDFFHQMKDKISKNGHSTFLFVHGYNVSFADAARRTAQITFDLRFNGEPVFYSWPSQASTTSYTIDEANIEWATSNIKNFLKDYLTKSEAKNIYLVAHSMGNRGLTKAIIELLAENPGLKEKITEVILAAPDIDADVFKRDIAPQMVQRLSKPITLYVSSDDLALIASQKVHGNNRAGFAGENVIVVKGIETIDASGVDESFLSHSYFATSGNLIKDIFDLMKSGKRATDRKTLEKISKDNVIYWKVKKGKN